MTVAPLFSRQMSLKNKLSLLTKMLGSEEALLKTIHGISSLHRRTTTRGCVNIYVRANEQQIFQVAHDAELIARGMGVGACKLNSIHYRASRSASAVAPHALARRVMTICGKINPDRHSAKNPHQSLRNH